MNTIKYSLVRITLFLTSSTSVYLCSTTVNTNTNFLRGREDTCGAAGATRRSDDEGLPCGPQADPLLDWFETQKPAEFGSKIWQNVGELYYIFFA